MGNDLLDFTISLPPELAQIKTVLADSIAISSVSFSSDITLDKEEITSLMELTDGATLSAEQLYRGCRHLEKKNKFQSVRLVGKPVDNKRYDLEVSLKACWTFGTITCQGPVVEKERYEQWYGISYGETFDLHKHRHGIDALIKALKHDGYLEAKIQDYVAYDKSRKSANVTANIVDAHRYVIKQISCKIDYPEDAEAQFKEKIMQKFLMQLQNSYSIKSEIFKIIDQLKAYLVRKGYINRKVSLRTSLDKETKTVSLDFAIMLTKKQRFSFLGNHFFTQQELLDQLMLGQDATFMIPPFLLVDDVLQLYKKKGFRSVSVTYKEEEDNGYFVINEGLRSELAGITVQEIGVPEKQVTLLSQQIINKAFAPAIHNPCDSALIKQCISRLLQHYYQLGYWFAQISSQEYQKEKETQGTELLNLVLKIEVGQQRMLKKVIIEGVDVSLPDNLTTISTPIPFNIDLIAQQQAAIVAYGKKEGIFYKAAPELEQTTEGDILTWHLTVIPQNTFGKTIIQGDNTLASKHLLGKLAYSEGEPFDKTKVQKSIARLKKLGIFKSLSLVQEAEALELEEKTMILRCIEDDPFEVRCRLGLQQISKNFTYTPQTTFKAGISLLWKNPTATADLFALDVDVTRYSRNASLQYSMPWMGNWAIATQYKIFSDAFEQPLQGGYKHRLYKANYDGITAAAHYWGDFLQVDGIASLQLIKVSGLSDTLAKLIHFEPALVDVRQPYLMIEPSFIIDNLDNKVDARSGTFTSFSCKGMYCFTHPSASFLRLLAEQSFFYPIYDFVGALRIKLGHIFCDTFNALLPSERFYLGGSNSLRGYEPAMVPPLGSDKKETFWVPIGGKSMVNINAEFRFPVWSGLHGVLFTDMGILSQDGFAVLERKWVGASGLGIRYQTPIGPLRFDVGWKWYKRDISDRRYAWFLTFGHAF